MSPHVTLASFVSLALIITGLTISIILWLFARVNDRSNKILSAAILSLTAALVFGLINQTYLILELPHFYRLGLVAALISYVLTYFYVRSVVLKRSIRPRDLLHAIPVCIYIIDFLPFFILPAHEKLPLIQLDLYGYYEVSNSNEGWLTPPGFHFYVRHLVMIVYWVLQFRLLFLFYSRTTGTITSSRLKTRSWLTYFIVSQVIGFAPLFIKPHDVHAQWILAIVSAGLPILITTIWLFLQPGILYGLNIPKYPVDHLAKKHRDTIEKETATNPGTLYELEFSERLHGYMEKSRKFLQHRYTINHLAGELGVPPHQLSSFLNQQLNTSFPEFLNKFRIEYCIERIKNGDARRLTLEALASECGFNNRNSFTAAFKRLTGVTPSEFMRDLA